MMFQMEVDAKDLKRGGDGSAKNDGVGFQHRHNFQVT